MASGKDELRSISSEEWGDIYMRLRLYTWRRYKWLHYKIGVDLDDFVHEAISDTLQGKRRWPPVDQDGLKKDMSFFFFLCQVVQSKVSHFWSQERRRVSVSEIEQDHTSDPVLHSFEMLLTESAQVYPTLWQTKGSDSDAIDNEFRNRLRDVVDGDEELMRIIELIIEDPRTNPRDCGIAGPRYQESVRRAETAPKKTGACQERIPRNGIGASPKNIALCIARAVHTREGGKQYARNEGRPSAS